MNKADEQRNCQCRICHTPDDGTRQIHFEKDSEDEDNSSRYSKETLDAYRKFGEQLVQIPPSVTMQMLAKLTDVDTITIPFVDYSDMPSLESDNDEAK